MKIYVFGGTAHTDIWIFSEAPPSDETILWGPWVAPRESDRKHIGWKECSLCSANKRKNGHIRYCRGGGCAVIQSSERCHEQNPSFKTDVCKRECVCVGGVSQRKQPPCFLWLYIQQLHNAPCWEGGLKLVDASSSLDGTVVGRRTHGLAYFFRWKWKKADQQKWTWSGIKSENLKPYHVLRIWEWATRANSSGLNMETLQEMCWKWCTHTFQQCYLFLANEVRIFLKRQLSDVCNSVCVFPSFILTVQQYLHHCENITHQSIFKFFTCLSCCFHNIWLFFLQICEHDHLIAGNVVRVLIHGIYGM